MDQLWGVLEQGLEVARGWGRTIDVWVARNVTREQQTYVLFGLIVTMVLHLVYTKRKLVREAKEEELEKSKTEQKKKK